MTTITETRAAPTYTFDFAMSVLPTTLHAKDGSGESFPIEVQIDTRAAYGCFERNDGAFSGGLWFDPAPGLCERGLQLADYDGVACLPRRVTYALRAAGFRVSSEFE